MLRQEKVSGLERLRKTLQAEGLQKKKSLVKDALQQASNAKHRIPLKIKGTDIEFDGQLSLKHSLVLVKVPVSVLKDIQVGTVLLLNSNHPHSKHENICLELTVAQLNHFSEDRYSVLFCQTPSKAFKINRFDRLAARQDVSEKDHYSIILKGHQLQVLDFSLTGIRVRVSQKQAELFSKDQLFHHVPFTADIYHIEMLFLKVKRIGPGELCARIGFNQEEMRKIQLLTNDHRALRYQM